MSSTTVRNLRPRPRPYDHQRDEDDVWVQASPIEWSVIAAAVERSGVVAAIEAMQPIADQVIAAQLARHHADLLDAHYEVNT